MSVSGIVMTDQTHEQQITFRCPPELESILPKPVPAVQGLPDWFKTMPQKAFNAASQNEQFTLKKCPPFIDAMTYGFLMPLVADLKVENGEFSWDRDVPGGAITNYPRSPLQFHDNTQVVGTPFYEDDRFIVKFTNFWTIELPRGFSLLITHPVNRRDLPFTTLTGLVDADTYHDNFIHFPACWENPDFTGIIAKGTPVAQCIPVNRESWAAKFETITGDAAQRLHDVSMTLALEQGVYRHEFRASKR
jgi:hypothetical protein